MDSRTQEATASSGPLPTRFGTKWPVVLVALVMVLSIGVPFVAGTPTGGTAHQVDAGQPVDASLQADAGQQADASTSQQWADPPGLLGQLGDDEADDETVDEEKRSAAEVGVNETIATLQRQGVSVNQSQRAAAVDGTLAAVAQHQNASVEQVQNASQGAVAGTLLQTQNVSVEQVQNATFGAASGALSQHGNASATQLQHAAHGAAHGAVAQHQNASIEQVQVVAQGAAAGAAHEAGKHDDESADGASSDEESKKKHPGAIREAAQGAAYGALTQTQNVSVEQRQYAATGAAEGALNQSQSATVEQNQTATAETNRTASIKEIQAAAMGSAKGSLTVSQRQEVTVRQIQGAARGASTGALTQVQSVSITQIQEASFGSAKGAISQSQQASVTQIQAAATGGAHGVVVQRQSISITQVQYAASGAAKGAARSAAQNQVIDVEQIQAAAAGAGEGSIVQIQQINVVMIQIISESAADGALSQHQQASVVQIQSAAHGASEGSLSLSQRQTVTIEQTQIVTQRAAANTASTAAELNIDVDVTIVNYAKGAAEDPDEADEDDDDEQLRSLFVTAEEDSIFLANPNDVAVTVTMTSEDGDLETVTLGAGESTTVGVDRGTYTLTAETADGETVDLAGRTELTVSVGDELQSLTATVEDDRLAVENPNDERVTVDVDGAVDASFDVPGNWEESIALGPGSYVATAETQDGESVPINGDDTFEFDIEGGEPPEPIELTASVNNGTLTVENPSETDVTATATPEDGEEDRTFDVAAGETATEAFEAGTYELTADADDDREVSINGESTFEFTVEAEGPEEPIDVNVTVDGTNVTFDNPSEADVTVTTTDDAGEEQVIDVSGGDTVTETLAPGNYTLTGESEDDREVLLDGESELELSIEEPAPDLESLNVTAQDGNVTIDNPNDVSVTVTANATDAENRTLDVAAASNVTEAFEPGNYTMTAATAEGTAVQLNGEQAFEFVVEPVEPGEPIDVNVTVDGTNVSLDNPSESDVTVTATDEAGEEQVIEVPGGETVTETLAPGNYTLTGESDDERTVLLDGELERQISVEEPPVEVESLTVTVGPENVTIENPNDVAVTVTANATDAANETDVANRTIDVPASTTVTETFEPGDYSLTAATADGTTVQLNSQDSFEFSVEPAAPIDINVTVEEGNVTVDNPGESLVSVLATAEAGTERSVDVPGGTNVTEAFEPGNYTLTATADGTQSVLLNGESELTIEVVEPPADGVDLQIDECGPITEPGQYELVGDLTSFEGESCLHVQTDDVTIDGNGFAVDGTDADTMDGEMTDQGTTGIALYNGTEPSAVVDNVTLANVSVRGWDEGIGTGPFFQHEANVTVLDSVVSDNEYGLRFTEADAATLDNVTIEENRVGMEASEGDDMIVRDSEVRANEETGILAGQATSFSSVTDTNVTENGGDGIFIANDGAPTRLDDVTVTENGGAGIVHDSDAANTIVQDARIENNTDGILLDRSSSDFTVTDTVVRNHTDDGILLAGTETTLDSRGTFENVSVRDSGGLDVNARNGSLTATVLQVGQPATLDFTDESVVLDEVPQASLPPLPDNATALAAGLNVSGVETSVQASFSPAGEPGEDESVELWRHDGAEWTTADDELEQPADSVTADVTDDGVYAVVAVADEPEAVQPDAPTVSVDLEEVQDDETALLNVSYENPNEEPLEPAESAFTNGTVTEQPPQVLDSGDGFALVEWTPESTEESVTWTVNLSNVGLQNVSATGPTAAEVAGLLEPSEDTSTPDATPEPGTEDEPAAIPDQEDAPEGPPTLGETPSQTPGAPPGDTPTPTPEPAPTDTPAPAPEDAETPTPAPGNETA